MFNKTLVLAVLATCAISAPVWAQDSWTLKSHTPHQTTRAGWVASGGSVYLFGGLTGAVALNETWKYDPAANTWTQMATCPIANFDMGAVLHADRIFSIGGTGIQTVLAYEPAANAWGSPTTLAPMPSERHGFACVEINDHIYAIGGLDASGPSTRVDDYNISTNTWMTGLPASPAVAHAFAGVVANQVVLAGGENGGVASAAAWTFNPATGAWTSLPDMPNANFGGASAVLGKRLYCFGGMESGRARSNVELDPAGTFGIYWTSRTNAPSDIRNGAATVVSHKAFVTGDLSNDNVLQYSKASLGNDPALVAGTLTQFEPLSGEAIVNGAWVRSTTLEFKGQITDSLSFGASTMDHVQLEVELRKVNETYTGIPNVIGDLGLTGECFAEATNIASGNYKWRGRAADEFDNVSPWVEFANPAFGVDVVAPTVPTPLLPEVDHQFPYTGYFNPLTDFRWTAATDDIALMKYEMQVCEDPAFSAVSIGGYSVTPAFTLYVGGATQYYWRVRSYDFAGNVSAWSAVSTFTFAAPPKDGPKTSTAGKSCGGSAPGNMSGIVVIVVVVAAMTTVRRSL